MHSFEDRSDCVYDVQWSPAHPGLFASGDCAGKVDLWNFNMDTEVQLLLAQRFVRWLKYLSRWGVELKTSRTLHRTNISTALKNNPCVT